MIDYLKEQTEHLKEELKTQENVTTMLYLTGQLSFANKLIDKIEEGEAVHVK